MSMSESHDLEAALRRLTPLAPSLDRDRLMYQAGRASRPGSGRYWAIATGLLALALAPLALRMSFDSSRPRAERMSMPAPAPALQQRTPRPPAPPVPSLEPDQTPYVTEENRSTEPVYF